MNYLLTKNREGNIFCYKRGRMPKKTTKMQAGFLFEIDRNFKKAKKVFKVSQYYDIIVMFEKDFLTVSDSYINFRGEII